jgi:glycosyltransferase involved in cell wall biosynthesis
MIRYKKCSLITTVYNELGSILNFLESYKRQTVYAAEFVVVDGGSSDGTFDLINIFSRNNPELNIRLILDEYANKKFISGAIAQGRNTAIQNARYEIIAVTDAGCILNENWLFNITKPLKNSSIDVVSGWYDVNITNRFTSDFKAISMPDVANVNSDKFLPSSRSIAFRKRCWIDVGGYPTKSYTGEDTYFDLKLKQMNFNFHFQPSATVLWNCPESIGDAIKKQYSYGFGDGVFLNGKLRFFINMIHILIPIRIFFNPLSLRQKSYKYILLVSNQFGYIRGMLK